MPRPIEAVVFDYGGVISSPLFRGVGRFEVDMGYPPGSVLELLFGERAYIGVEGRMVLGDGPPVTLDTVPESARSASGQTGWRAGPRPSPWSVQMVHGSTSGYARLPILPVANMTISTRRISPPRPPPIAGPPR